jgi:dienelactone hydrolase
MKRTGDSERPIMTGSYVDYLDGTDTCEAYVALPQGSGPHPAVLVAHQWSGQSDHERATADRMAALGYVGIAIDVYGKGVRGAPDATDHSALMMPWAGNRAALKKRLMAAVSFAKGHDAVDPGKIAIMGYCFGGLCALDVARTGTTDVKGAVSIHGVFGAPDIGPQADIATKVLILHGWDDPMAQPETVLKVTEELTEAKADWQLHAYGHTMHAFTAKEANMPERGLQYSADADRRSWAATVTFLEEVFA